MFLYSTFDFKVAVFALRLLFSTMIRTFEELKKKAKKKGRRELVIACAEDKTALEASLHAAHEELVSPIFVGNKEKILAIAKAHALDVDQNSIENVDNRTDAVSVSIEIVRSHKGSFLLKGMVKTSAFLKGVLNPQTGLCTGRRLSHSAMLQVPGYHKLIQLTDGGMNIRPDIQTKIDIIKNAQSFALSLGIEQPKIALLSAIEVVNPDMPETVDAAIIKQMAERGQLGEILIDGPLALDLAVSKEACAIKGVQSDIAGDADILIVPDIAAGNIAAKALIYLGNALAAGIILGAQSPVVMLSRADDTETKLNSIALGVLSC
ncbi:MAG: bifunctional enoyl-CoA hydratase/phosphate acetyltransferase [Candidatus Cloacimonadota bacterium]|nr:MAG: bifunctional enoyl-CoA hydratase/phosphate acetyltransferase [Candidatus Cloacimonadota bacterium]